MNRPPPLLMAELHVDDLALERGGSFEEAQALVMAIAEAAEGAKAKLGIRFRQTFATEAARRRRANPLRALETHGHEIGTHAHGRGLDKARRAVSACGVANRGATPGMVQAGERVDRLWRETHRLGFRWVVDHAPFRAWAYAGHVPWWPGPGFRPDQPALGPAMLDTAADPFAWGLLEHRGREVRHSFGLDDSHFERLESLLEAHGCPLPDGAQGFFVFALHEHNFCAEGSLRPLPRALDAFAAFLARHRVATAEQVLAGLREPEVMPRTAPKPAPLRFARKIEVATRPARRRMRRRAPSGPGPFAVQREDQRLHAMWLGPTVPRGVLVISHAGLRGGTRTLLGPFGIDPRWLTAEGIALVAYDRSGTGRSPSATTLTPGNPLHVQDFDAVLQSVRNRVDPGLPLGVLSFSSGVLPPLRAAGSFDFLLDGEAPASRWDLRPPHALQAPKDDRLASLPLDCEVSWHGREPARLVGRLACPYHRFQAQFDHVHGRLDLHARLMLEAARAGSCTSVRANGGDTLRLLPGHLHVHGRRLQAWILESFEDQSG